MPRDASGNYTLPAGNPVVPGTTITATWANATMPDIGNEITDSLSRSGQGGMLVPFRVLDGTALEPSYSFTNTITLGTYRVAASIMGFAAGGLLQATLDDGLAGAQSLFTNAKLKGYLVNGFSEAYASDLDLITSNSNYHFRSISVTNEPADMGDAWAVITTQPLTTGGDVVQTIRGITGTSQYKTWQRQRASSVWGAWKLVVDGAAAPGGYLEGTWTPTGIGVGGTFQNADYIKNGNLVYLEADISFGTGAGVFFTGIPFPMKVSASGSGSVGFSTMALGTTMGFLAQTTNLQFYIDNVAQDPSSERFIVSMWYIAA